MGNANLTTQSAALEAVAMRVTQLNPDGSWSSGNGLYVTNAFTKVSPSPQMETGDDITTKNAAGDLCVMYKHGDMTKRYDFEIDLCAPDENLEQFLAGGTVLTDTSAALVAPTGATGTPSGTGGTLVSGSYQYQVTTVGRYGETTPGTAVTAAVTGSGTGSVTVTWTAVTGTVVGYNIYRKIPGAATYAQVGAVPKATLSFVDVGGAPIAGAPPSVNTTSGPGAVGYAVPSLGIVGAPNGVSVEVWTRNIVNGNAFGYRRWLYPWVRNLIRDNYNLDNNPVDNVFKGEAYGNPNWGSGPVGDWPLASSQVCQRALEMTFPAATNGPTVVP
jgi:hypothetical protein